MKLKKLFAILFAFAPVFLLAQTYPSQTASRRFSIGENDHYLPAKILFRIRPEYRASVLESGINDPQLEKIFQTIGAHGFKKAFTGSEPPREKTNSLGQELVDLSLVFEIDIDPSYDLEKAINLLLFCSEIEYAQPNYTYELLYDPNDPDTGLQYYLSIIKARQAWDISQGDTNLVAGIIDTGTSFTNPEYVGRILKNLNDTIDGLDNDNDGYIDNYQGWDFGGDYFQSPGDNNPQWCCGNPATDHGVLVSGPIAAITDNGTCMASIGFNCKILPVKTTVNNNTFLIRAFQGVVYAADHGADMLNMSFGGTPLDRFGEDATRYAAINKGCLLVGSAGNTIGDYRFYPASFPWVLSTGGSDGGDVFWNGGGTFGSTYSYQVDISAPAANILTTAQDGICWAGATGTSMATPMILGGAVLVKAEFPSLNMHQVGQKVRMSADDIYALNPASYSQKMGRGRLNCYRALTDVNPAVRVADIYYEDLDGDGLFMAGDTVLVRTRFVNYLDPVQNLNITMTSATTAISIIHGSAFAGDLGMMDTVSTWNCPFKIKINTPGNNFVGNLKFSYAGDSYSDYEYYIINLSPNFVKIDRNDIETCIDNTGHFSIFNYPTLSLGSGTDVEGNGTYLLDAGFLIGTSATKVSNNVHNASNSQDSHFASAQSASRAIPGVYADLEAMALFNDNPAGGNQLDVTVTEKVYQFDSEEDKDYIIIEYSIHNDGASPVSNAYAGMYSNWELGWPVNNFSHYDSVNRTVWAYEPIGTSPSHIAMSLLTGDSLHAFTESIDSFSFTMADKWTALTSNPTAANSDTTDIIQFISAGPFTIAAGGNHTIAFVWVEGTNTSDLFAKRQTALDKYNCVILGGMSGSLNLGSDFVKCDGDTNLVLDAGSGFSSYLWNTGASTQTISVSGSGDYRVTVTDAAGCMDYDYMNVTINDGLVGGFTWNPSGIFTGDTVTFDDTTSGANEWCWDFGDGNNLCPILSQVQHAYTAPGIYPITLIVSNGICNDTVTLNITVDSLVGTQRPLAEKHFIVYPNPASNQLFIQGMANQSDCIALNGRLFSMAGQLMKEKSFAEENWMETGDLARGIYFLQIHCNDRVETFKIVLE